MGVWNGTTNCLPAAQSRNEELYPALSFILQEARRSLSTLSSNDAIPQQEIERSVDRAAATLGFELAPYERDQILSHLEKDQRLFGILQPLVDDGEVSDIIVSSYAKISVQKGRRNYTTRLSFPNQAAYEAFVEKLLFRAGTTYSTRQPVTDGMIGSTARVHAVHRSVSEGGPYLTIRLNRFETVSESDLIQNGLAPREVFTYLQTLVSTGHTVLIAGEVGTGKTTLLRALASKMPFEESLLVIEDTPEIRLDHPHVRYVTTREENSEGAGRIAPSACIRAGMRMAMNRIIFGEIRDAEAAEAFIDVCASGHPGLSTIHARSSMESISRLELFLGRAQPGVGRSVLSEQIATAVQVIVHVGLCGTTSTRRIFEVREIGPIADGVIRQRLIFQYRTERATPTWAVAHRVSAHREYLEPALRLGAIQSPLTV